LHYQFGAFFIFRQFVMAVFLLLFRPLSLAAKKSGQKACPARETAVKTTLGGKFSLTS
jgi:hypothetical protein